MQRGVQKLKQRKDAMSIREETSERNLQLYREFLDELLSLNEEVYSVKDVKWFARELEVKLSRDELTDFLADVISCYSNYVATAVSILSDPTYKNNEERLEEIGIFAETLEVELENTCEEYEQANEEFKKFYSDSVFFRRKD